MYVWFAGTDQYREPWGLAFPGFVNQILNANFSTFYLLVFFFPGIKSKAF